MKDLTMSQVAKATNINLETVRYYLKRGLIVEPPRTESGYRRFSLETIERIQFIKRAQELGFSLEEIKQLLWISEKEKDSEKVLKYTSNKIEEIKEKIKDLINIKDKLEQLSKQCKGSESPIGECPIINAFTEKDS